MRTRTPRDSQPPVGDCLFQIGICCRAANGTIGEYPRAPRLREDLELQELELLYDSVRAYAVGHGCAADWEEAELGRATEVRTSFVPTFELPAIVPRNLDLSVLEARRASLKGGARAKQHRRRTAVHSCRATRCGDKSGPGEAGGVLQDHLKPAADRVLEKIGVALETHESWRRSA